MTARAPRRKPGHSYMHTAITDALACLHQQHLRPQVLLVADLDRPQTANRLTVIDLHGPRPRVLLRATVAQGAGGFGDAPHSHASAPGLYAIGNPYTGKHGLSWHLVGLSRSDRHAVARDVVLHSAPYVVPGWAGRSWGCPAVSAVTLHRLEALQALPPAGAAALWIQAPGALCR